MRIGLIGNPNSGKTTLFNDLTGSTQYVGNWPGVTVEKKEGKLRKHRKDITVVDLPGVYSLSPYTLEEIITRDFIINEKPDVLINIVDASNLERNLYLTTQVMETGIPTVIALNMMDLIESAGDELNAAEMSRKLGVPVVPIVAKKGKDIDKLMETTLKAAGSQWKAPGFLYSENIKEFIHNTEELLQGVEENQKRYYAVKIFENDEEFLQKHNLAQIADQLSEDRADIEEVEDEDAESLITAGRYDYIGSIIGDFYKKNRSASLSLSDKIDKVVTNKWIGLPIFFGIMWVIYYVAISTVGDWTIGWVEGIVETLQENATSFLEGAGASEPVVSLVANGVIGGLGAIFTFVPQLMILFFFLSLLEDSGYMARVAFIMDRLFRKFGLSGKSFIPMLIGTGCSIPGVMASRTIESEKDRKMTILLTPFVPCGAKLPVFAMFIALFFREHTWVGPSIYLIALVVIIISGLLLKQTRMFRGDPAPFVMELPKYSLPGAKGVLIHMWDRGKSFIKKAGTIIFIANVLIWFLMSFSWNLSYIGEDIGDSMLAAIGEKIRFIFIPLGFGDSWPAPVATFTGLIAKEVVVTTFATIGSVADIVFSQVTAFSFMIFTIFAAPCFAAIGAMKREFGSMKTTLFAVGFQTGLAYVFAALTNFFGNLLLKGTDAVKPMVLDYTTLEELSESVELVEGGDVSVYIFGGFLILAIVAVILTTVFRKKKRLQKAGVN